MEPIVLDDIRPKVESQTLDAFIEEFPKCARPEDRRVRLDPDNVKNGLAQLVLTLVRLLHELLERQAIRRIEADSLSETQIERIGLTLMRQSEEITRLRQVFGLEEEDLNLNLGPLGDLL